MDPMLVRRHINVISSALRLFGAVPIICSDNLQVTCSRVHLETSCGFMLHPSIYSHYTESQVTDIIAIIKSTIALDPVEFNSTFHKSWAKVRDTNMAQLVVEQIIHYFTTYGLEAMGLYDENLVYIPAEQLDIPDLDEITRIPIVIIKGYTNDELREKCLTMLQSGIALKQETLNDIMVVLQFVGNITINNLETIKNKEAKILLYEYFNIVPRNSIEFLRYVIYKITDKTLLIKNKETIASIKLNPMKYNLIENLFSNYENNYGLTRLAEIFFRFKPIFLAFRVNSNMKSRINKIRKLAKKYHKPMPKDFLNEVTAMLSRNETISLGILREELAKVNVFRKIRLLHALSYRTSEDIDSILYKIRNGKGYAKEFSFSNKIGAKEILGIVLDSIADSMTKVYGKKVYIPKYISYGLPATEKQFSGPFPFGTSIKVNQDTIMVGIHWVDTKGRVDLDLSATCLNKKIGWDGGYRAGGVLFSGDMTSAPLPNGATEVLNFVGKDLEDQFLININTYTNYDGKGIDIPFKLFVATDNPANMCHNYIVDPNKILVTIPCKAKQHTAIGSILKSKDCCKFVLSEFSFNNGITTRHTPYSEQSRKYCINFYEKTLTFEDLLIKAGAILVDTVEEADIDLSPNVLEQDTLINIMTDQ